MPFGLTPVHLIIILAVILIVVGPGKLPEVGSAFGKAIREFRSASTDLQGGIQNPPPVPAPNTMSTPTPNTFAADAGPAVGARDVTPRGTPSVPFDDKA